MITFILYLFIFIFGLCIGSFLNCLIYRLEKEQSMMGRSYCPHCQHTLSWFDLVPVLSYLWLGGKCRSCHKKISIQYPLVELLTGFIFLLVFHFQIASFDSYVSYSLLSFFWYYIASSLLVIFVYDLKFFLIPDKVLFPAILVAVLYHFGLTYFLAAALASGFFLALFLVSKGTWMGFGDVKLAILLGLLLGFPNILVGLFLAFFFGAVVGVTLMYAPLPKAHKIGLKSQLPFAPFLIAGTFVALFWGTTLIDFYTSFFSL
jgi:prepilin signal peptidase PulO-like enzyme (type II secretory pathway)